MLRNVRYNFGNIVFDMFHEVPRDAEGFDLQIRALAERFGAADLSGAPTLDLADPDGLLRVAWPAVMLDPKLVQIERNAVILTQHRETGTTVWDRATAEPPAPPAPVVAPSPPPVVPPVPAPVRAEAPTRRLRRWLRWDGSRTFRGSCNRSFGAINPVIYAERSPSLTLSSLHWLGHQLWLCLELEDAHNTRALLLRIHLELPGLPIGSLVYQELIEGEALDQLPLEPQPSTEPDTDSESTALLAGACALQVEAWASTRVQDYVHQRGGGRHPPETRAGARCHAPQPQPLELRALPDLALVFRPLEQTQVPQPESSPLPVLVRGIRGTVTIDGRHYAELHTYTRDPHDCDALAYLMRQQFAERVHPGALRQLAERATAAALARPASEQGPEPTGSRQDLAVLGQLLGVEISLYDPSGRCLAAPAIQPERFHHRFRLVERKQARARASLAPLTLNIPDLSETSPVPYEFSGSDLEAWYRDTTLSPPRRIPCPGSLLRRVTRFYRHTTYRLITGEPSHPRQNTPPSTHQPSLTHQGEIP